MFDRGDHVTEAMKKEGVFLKVHCPKCGNGRLFDVGLEARGTIRIKCPVCKNSVEIQLEKCDESRQKRLSAYYRNINRGNYY